MTGAGGLDTQGQYTQTNTLSCTQRRDTRTCIHTCRSGQATASPKHLENNILNLGMSPTLSKSERFLEKVSSRGWRSQETPDSHLSPPPFRGSHTCHMLLYEFGGSGFCPGHGILSCMAKCLVLLVHPC